MHQPEQAKEKRPIGFGQLSLVEHSLCPLSRQSSLVDNLVHQAEYRYTDARRRRQTAKGSPEWHCRS